ncbi:hypothetical protein [Rhizobium leguminosarum]|uniref:hypothetical protein n=1 Tax=Rhizobium leguminosarum TaxID=384 RepID=UPI001C98AA60|nr:hypothetical protein [Rhizobium leguminosarum]MBY5660921.1 hypothetical protein [Rhizobium leguminosarum]MBY5674957.1 hypothetical protein [Rhizobium leguminosarum]
MLKAIAAAIARLFKIGVGGLRWCENLVLSPFRALFGGGGALPNPEFNPTVTSTELLDEYEANRKAQAALQRSDRDGIECVVKYAAASPAARAMTDLSAVPADARLVLLAMDDHELKALAAGGPGRVRKWVEGKNHGIFGVPTVSPASPTNVVPAPSRPPAGMTPQQQMVWRVQAHLGKPDHSKEFRIA